MEKGRAEKLVLRMRSGIGRAGRVLGPLVVSRGLPAALSFAALAESGSWPKKSGHSPGSQSDCEHATGPAYRSTIRSFGRNVSTASCQRSVERDDREAVSKYRRPPASHPGPVAGWPGNSLTPCRSEPDRAQSDRSADVRSRSSACGLRRPARELVAAMTVCVRLASDSAAP